MSRRRTSTIRWMRTLAQAEAVFGSTEKAIRWMIQPLRRFGGRTPLQMITTEAGVRMVEEMLIQIDEGIYM